MAEGDLDPDLEDDLGLEGDPGLDLKNVPEDDPGLLLEDDLAHALTGIDLSPEIQESLTKYQKIKSKYFDKFTKYCLFFVGPDPSLGLNPDQDPGPGPDDRCTALKTIHVLLCNF